MELTKIKGIGTNRQQAFYDNDIFSCEDLINYFPYKYYNFSKTEPFSQDGKVRLIKATIAEQPKLVKAKAGLCFVTVKAIDETGHSFNAVWFNQMYMKSSLYIGEELYLYGKNSPKKKDTFNVLMFKQANKMSKLGFLPVYHSIGNVGQKSLNDYIFQSLETLNLSSFIPNNLLLKYNLTDLKQAYYSIHNPETEQEIVDARNRIEIEKLIPILASNEYHKFSDRQKRINTYENITKYIDEFENILPYKLTLDQKQAINDIEYDLSGKYSMNRLLEGDVGSGKTIIALFGAFLAAKNNYQSVIVAPTEILAKQHYETAKKLFENQDIKIRLLTSSTSVAERRQILGEIKYGLTQVVIGTHSIFSDDVIFKNLSFIVIDEQHRFGVEQRAIINKKGNSPDILVMSATPIPRTLALVLHGNLDISIINQRPKSANIQTNIVIKSKQNDMWNYIKNKLENGSKAYIVCSKIDEENEDDETISFSAKNMYEYLCNIFDKDKIGLIHGKMKKELQDSVIEKFRKGTINMLVSTTIVEVGVDIPDSDIMVIATPERFGLATLHQLRGRIGRDGTESHCFCLANNLNEKTYERINYFKNHSNGFDIADFDLKTRGTGSLLGTNQHGSDESITSNFSIESFNLSREILEQIKPDIKLFTKIISIGEELTKNKLDKNIVLN